MSDRETTISVARGEWPLADSVKPYHRHAFACTGDRSWPARLEDHAGLLGMMAREVRDLRDSAGSVPKLTATDDASKGPGISRVTRAGYPTLAAREPQAPGDRAGS